MSGPGLSPKQARAFGWLAASWVLTILEAGVRGSASHSRSVEDLQYCRDGLWRYGRDQFERYPPMALAAGLHCTLPRPGVVSAGLGVGSRSERRAGPS